MDLPNVSRKSIKAQVYVRLLVSCKYLGGDYKGHAHVQGH